MTFLYGYLVGMGVYFVFFVLWGMVTDPPDKQTARGLLGLPVWPVMIPILVFMLLKSLCKGVPALWILAEFPVPKSSKSKGRIR